MNHKTNIDNGSPESVKLQKQGKSVRPAYAQSTMLVRLLPYVLLALAVWAVPAFIYKPSPEGGNYHLTVLIYVGIHTLLAVGLNLLMGYAGQISLGHAAFYGIGAYVSAILSTQQVPAEVIRPIAAVVGIMAVTAAVIAILKAESWRLALGAGCFALIIMAQLRFGWHHCFTLSTVIVSLVALLAAFRSELLKLIAAYALAGLVTFAANGILQSSISSDGISPWYAMIAGVFFASLTAYLIGVQALKLHGHYLAMATLGFGVIVSIVFLQWEPVTGGTSGIYGIPSLSIAGKPVDNDISMYYLVWVLVIGVIALSANIVNSRIGRAFRAVHGSEVAATTLGVDTARYKVQVFVLSAALASVAGSLYAHYVTFISPEPFGFRCSVELVVMVVVGGMASIWGAIFGAGTITVLGEILRGLEHVNTGSLGISLSDFDVVVFGLILMLIMIYLPAGLVRGVVDSARFAIRFGLKKERKGR